MADRLLLQGKKHVRSQSGNELRLLRPKRGGDTHQISRWWGRKGNVVYEACAVFAVTSTVGNLRLVVPVGGKETIYLWINHDGDGRFTFDNKFVGIDRVAVYSEDMTTLYEEYQFPRISGGAVLRRTVNALPSGDTTVDTVSVAGETAPTNGTDEVYTATVTGDATPYVYTWSATGGTISAGQGTASATVSWTSTGAGSVTCTVDSTNGSFDGNTVADTLNTNVAVLFATRVANANFSYIVTVDNGEFELDGVANAGIAGAVGDTFYFDLSDASLSGHPFKIYTDSSKTTEVTVGVEQEGTDLLFSPPIAGTFSYQCANHDDMGGTITVS